MQQWKKEFKGSRIVVSITTFWKIGSPQGEDARRRRRKYRRMENKHVYKIYCFKIIILIQVFCSSLYINHLMTKLHYVRGYQKVFVHLMIVL